MYNAAPNPIVNKIMGHMQKEFLSSSAANVEKNIE